MMNLGTKLNELSKVIDITQEKLENNEISLVDAQYINLVINKYLDIVVK